MCASDEGDTGILEVATTGDRPTDPQNQAATAEIPDHLQRQRALDPEGSFIVQAPAGSGKTDLLIRRVLRLLARAEVPEEILAITFTRKAAAEMRERIHQMLQAAWEGVEPEDEYQAQGLAMAQAVLQRSEAQGWNLLENPQRLGMQTIDSLCAALTRQLPLTSSLGAPLATVDLAKPLYLAAANRLLDRALRDQEELGQSLRFMLLQFDNKVQRLQNMLASMLANRDQWLRYISMSTERESLESSLAMVVQSRLQAIADAAPDFSVDDFVASVEHANHCCLELFDDDSYGELVVLGTLPQAHLEHGEAWVALRKLLLTDKGTVRKSLTRKAGFPTSAADASELGLDVAYLKERKAMFVALLSTLGDSDEFVALLSKVDRLPFAGYTDQQWIVLQHLSVLLMHAVAELHLGFGQQGKCDFSEISQRAGRALGNEDNPTDLALALDYRIRHILVDEFQDTSISQFELFSRLVAGWETGDGRTFFAVGDPMQSIYRFRDAEVSLFADAQVHGIEAVELEPLTLSVNFRSDPHLVNWCNTSFERLFPKHSNSVTGAVPFANSTAFKSADPDSTQANYFYAGDLKSEQAQQIVEILQDAFNDDAEQSIAILVRSKNHLTEIFQALRNADIACQAIEMEALGSRPVVRDIRMLCDALMHPSDRVAWLGLLRAPWLGLSLVELHKIVQHARYASIWETVCQLVTEPDPSDGSDLTIDADTADRLARFVEVIKPAMNRAVREEIVAWVESSWLQLGGPAVCENPADLLAANTAFSTLLALEADSLLWDRSAVELRMQALFAPAAEPAAPNVQVMTIHKSKGLEFDTVILPNLGRKTGVDSQSLLNWFELIDDDGESHLLLAPLDTTDESRQSNPIVKLIKSFHDEREANERVRLMYVAATRARKHLHLLGHSKMTDEGEINPPQTGSLLHMLWPIMSEQFMAEQSGGQINQQSGNDASEEPPLENTALSDSGTADSSTSKLQQIEPGWRIPESLACFQWSKCADDEVSATSSLETGLSDLEFQWAGMNASAIGTVVHQQLQRICEEGVQLWTPERIKQLADEYRLQLKLNGVGNAHLKTCVGRVVKGLVQSIEDERGRWVLDNSHAQSSNELALSTVNDAGELQQVVLDRVFIDSEGTRWIVDYKTGDHRGGSVEEFLDRECERYKPQLENYARIVKKLVDQQNEVLPDPARVPKIAGQAELRVALYFPLLRGWRAWEPRM